VYQEVEIGVQLVCVDYLMQSDHCAVVMVFKFKISSHSCTVHVFESIKKKNASIKLSYSPKT